MRIHLRNLVPAVLLCCFNLATVALAAPAEVKDAAGFFSPGAIKKAEAIIHDLEQRHHKEVQVETFMTVPGGKAPEVKAMDKLSRDHFFADWLRELAQEDRTDGVFILICREPGHVQVGVGAETRKKAFTATDRDRVREQLVAHFREKEYDRGLVEAVEMVRTTMDRHLGASSVTSQSTRAHTSAAGTRATSGIMGLVCLGLVIVLGIWLVIGVVRAFSGGGGGGYMGGGGMGGGGFFPGLLGGLFGGMAGAWLYDSFFHGGNQAYGSDSTFGGADAGATGADDGNDFTSSGSDIGDTGGGDFDGGDYGGGDYGGGDFGGGDFGGGDFGGGDF